MPPSARHPQPLKAGRRAAWFLVALAALAYVLLPGLPGAHAWSAHAGPHDGPSESQPAQDDRDCDLCALAGTLQAGCDVGPVMPHLGDAPAAAKVRILSSSVFPGCPIPVAALPRAPPAA